MLKKIYKYNNYDLLTKTITGTIKEPIVLAYSEPDEDYIEQTSIIDVYKCLQIIKADNILMQDNILKSYTLQTWTNMTVEEKNIMIDLSIGTNDSEKIIHLISTGQATDTDSAIGVLKDSWVSNHPKNIIACQKRHSSKKLLKIISKYLNISDAEDLQHTLRNLALDYTQQGIRGVIHRGETYGLLDYFNSTVGTPYETAGLKESKNYTMQNGDLNMDNFIADLLDIFLYGNY